MNLLRKPRWSVKPKRSVLLVALVALFALAPRSALAQLPINSFTVTAGPNPIPAGQTTTLTAVVSGTSQTPTGTVSFFETNSGSCATDSANLGTPQKLDNAGTATLANISLPATVDVCATYSGDYSYATETAGPVAVTVLPYGTTIGASAAPTTFTYGQAGAASFAATVTRSSAADAAVPAGQVSFGLTGPQNVTLGTAKLSQVNAAGAYQVMGAATMDARSTKVLSADLNRDGFADLVSLPQYASSNYLQVLLSTGADGLRTQSQASVGACNAQDFAIGDLNRDGIPDLVAVCSTSGPPTAVYLLGNGDGTFQAPVAFATDATLLSGAYIAIGDFNGDGAMDVAVVDSNDGAFQVFTGSATFGTFTAQPQLAIDTTSGFIQGIGAADFNQDGKSDLAILEYGNYSSQTVPTAGAVLILTSDGTGAFSTAVQTFAAQAVSYNQSGFELTIADVNGDGYPDVGVTDPGNSALTSGAAPFRPGKGNQPRPQVLPNPDTGQVIVLENNGKGALNPAVAFVAPGATSIVGSPFPSVGKPAATAAAAPGWSLVYLSHDANNVLTLTALQRQSATSYTPAYTINPGASIECCSNGTDVAVGDLNGDGYLDAAVLAQTSSSYAYELVPAFYGNDSHATLTGTTIQANAGTYQLTASYAGNLLFAAGASRGTQIVITPATPGGTVSAPATAAYGQSITVTAALAGVPGGTTPSGTVQFLDNGGPLGAAQTLVAGGAQLATAALTAGRHTISASYAGDMNYAALPGFGAAAIVVSQATATVRWATPAPIVYGTPLSAAQLNATASVPGAFVYAPAAGTILGIGTHALGVTFTPTDTTDYGVVTASVNLVVNSPALALASIDPVSGNLGSGATTITLTGTGFTPNSQVLVKGAAVATTYVSLTQLKAVIPAADFAQAGTLTVTVNDSGVTTGGQVFTVLPPSVQVQLSGPGTEQPGQQPTLTFTLQQPYPADIQGTFTLSVQPGTSGGPVDPAVQFASGGDTFTFTIPANTTTTPPVQLQTGTVAATLTVTLTLEAGGTDITPASLQPVVITVPAAAPTISSITLTRSGKTLTVTMQGFSSTRDVTQAIFSFTAAAGATINNPQNTVDVTSAFTGWYGQSTSTQYGSAFSYVQSFTLSDDASTVQSVSATLTNSVGTSNSRSAQ